MHVGGEEHIRLVSQDLIRPRSLEGKGRERRKVLEEAGESGTGLASGVFPHG